jgi:hypothetical protein
MFFSNVNGAEKQRLFDKRTFKRLGKRLRKLIKTFDIPYFFDYSLHKNALTSFWDYDRGQPIFCVGAEEFLNGTLCALFAHTKGVPQGWSFHQICSFYGCGNRTSVSGNRPFQYCSSGLSDLTAVGETLEM